MTFLSFVVPPVLGYFLIAWLSVSQHTHTLGVALWPVLAFLAYRAAVSVDLSSGDPDTKNFNGFIVVLMLGIVIRTFDWSLEKWPLARTTPPAKDPKTTLMDAIDLATTLRGQGWAWSRGVYIPRETRPTDHRGFACHVILSAAFHALFCSVLYSAIRSFSPDGLGSPSGGSTFDETLPFHVRYLRASIIGTLIAWADYAAIQACYDICTIVGVLVFRQDPTQWPPAFDSPWRATSMSDFWGRRWHQFFRRMFLVHGGYPLSIVLGKAGLVIGSFLSSGVLHHIVMLSLNSKSELWRAVIGFGMMAPVVLVEQMLRQWTGKKISGTFGWAWTIAWLYVCGNPIADAFARGGVFGHMNFVDRMVPGRAVIHALVTNLDARLRAM